MFFPESGVTIHPALPLALSFLLTLVMSTAGITGAFALLPFQVSVLGYTTPGVTPTNHLFNVIAIPGGVYRYMREGRMVWPLALVMIAGVLPGVVAGSVARLYLLPDPEAFKLFMGLVLLLIGTRLLRKILTGRRTPPPAAASEPDEFRVQMRRFDLQRLEYEFAGATHGLAVMPLAGISLVVGVIGGAYGVGGGAILAPVLIAGFRLPVHTTAGATLLVTWVSSLAAVATFALLATWFGQADASPDWLLGLLFGLGGIGGMYTGAALQRRLPARLIESVLGLGVSALALNYVVNYFL